jgi:hypothetical protein
MERDGFSKTPRLITGHKIMPTIKFGSMQE